MLTQSTNFKPSRIWQRDSDFMVSGIDWRILCLAAVALIVLGAKLVLINHYGSNVPYWDQWDAEADGLYKPLLNGTLDFSNFIRPHNEHRILITRLFALLLLEMDGVWFPTLQMVANAIVHVIGIGLFLTTIGRGLDRAGYLALCAATALFYALPFGWENTLAGFQSQFYFVFLFSVLAIRSMVPAAAFSASWLLGLAALVAAYFSLSSGALTAMAVAILSVLQAATGNRPRSPREMLGVAVLLVLFLAMYAGIPHIVPHDALKAHGPAQFFGALVTTASWPLPRHLALAVLLNLPVVILLIHLVVKRPPAGHPGWLVLAMMAWVGLQWVSFAYGRADNPIASRYQDTLIVGLLVNGAAALTLAGATPIRRVASYGYGLALCIVVVISSSSAMFIEAPARKASYDTQASNLAAYIRTGDLQKMASLPFFSIPYPSAERLAALVDDPAVRSILHPELTGQDLTDRLFLPKPVTKFFRGVQIVLLRCGWGLLALGTAFFMVSLMTAFRHRPDDKMGPCET